MMNRRRLLMTACAGGALGLMGTGQAQAQAELLARWPAGTALPASDRVLVYAPDGQPRRNGAPLPLPLSRQSGWTALEHDLFDRQPLIGAHVVELADGRRAAVLAVGAGLGEVFFERASSYALAVLVLMLMLLPFQVTMAPSVLTMRTLGLMNTRWAVILPMIFAPLYVFLIRQYMVGIPTDMFEAAMMDGAGTWRCFAHMVMPISKPILGAAAALSFADGWNMVEQPLIYLSNDQGAMPLSVMFDRVAASEPGVAFAGAALYIMPALLIYTYFQEDILLGIQLSDMK